MLPSRFFWILCNSGKFTPSLIESTENSIQNDENVGTNKDENGAEPYDYCGENSDEDSDPYGYRAEMLGQHLTSSDDDY